MFTALTFVADRGLPGGGMHHDRDRWWGWGVLVIVAVLAAAVLLTWFLARSRPVPAAAGVAPPIAQSTTSPTASAEGILAERLARSEITPDEYRTLLQALQGGTSSPVPPPPATGEPTPPAS